LSRKYIIHRRDNDNAGDMASNPKLYFPKWLKDFKTIDIVDVQWVNLRNADVILGGGGLLYDDFAPFMKHLIQSDLKSLTLWGIGRNRHGVDDDSLPSFGQALIDKADLVGIRDCRIDPKWVPCVSIMHPLFDRDATSMVKRSTFNEVLAVQHREDRFRFSYPNRPPDWNEVKMQGPVADIIREIVASEIVLSSSYHGALWGVCAGTKVAAVNGFSQKFQTGLPDSVLVLDSLELNLSTEHKQKILDSICPNDDYLRLARTRTLSFAAKVRKLVEK